LDGFEEGVVVLGMVPTSWGFRGLGFVLDVFEEGVAMLGMAPTSWGSLVPGSVYHGFEKGVVVLRIPRQVGDSRVRELCGMAGGQ
jgi:hypothetical protein